MAAGCFGGCCVPPEGAEEPLKYDPNFKGPVKNRYCTDIAWLVVFLIFILLWLVLGIYSMTSGKVENFIAPIDSNGLRCGLDPGLENKQYLIFFRSSECFSANSKHGHPTPGSGCRTLEVCVEACPNETIYFDQAFSQSPFDQLRPKMICLRGVNIENLSQSQAQQYINEGRCAKYVMKSRPTLGRCHPIERDTLNSNAARDERGISIGQMAWHVFEDVVLARWCMLAILLIAVIVCFIYMFLLRWTATPVVWASIVAVFALFGFGMYLCYKQYQNDKENSTLWLIILIVMAAFAVGFLILVIFLRARIAMAIVLMKEGSKAVWAVILTIFFPILPWIFLCIVAAYTIAVFVHLLSIGETTFEIHNLSEDSSCECSQNIYSQDRTSCDPALFSKHCHDKRQGGPCQRATCSFTGLNTPGYVIFLHFLNIFGFFWAVAFINGVADMILAGTYAAWYWTFEKKNLPLSTLGSAIFRTIRYHLGTVALGALVIAIIKLLRAILEYVEQKFRGLNNCLARFIFCCCEYFFWFLENIIRFINKNVYIVCAIHGTNFCSSAKHAFSLLTRNILNVVVLDQILSIIFIIFEVLISLVAGVILFYLLQWKFGEQLNYSFIPPIILGVITFFICTIAFNVYSMAVDTIFLCYLEDCERNDGSPEKPYYMSKNLRKLLDKRNQQTDRN